MRILNFFSRPEDPKCLKYQNVPNLGSFWAIGKPWERFQSGDIRIYFIPVPKDHTVIHHKCTVRDFYTNLMNLQATTPLSIVMSGISWRLGNARLRRRRSCDLWEKEPRVQTQRTRWKSTVSQTYISKFKFIGHLQKICQGFMRISFTFCKRQSFTSCENSPKVVNFPL